MTSAVIARSWSSAARGKCARNRARTEERGIESEGRRGSDWVEQEDGKAGRIGIEQEGRGEREEQTIAKEVNRSGSYSQLRRLSSSRPSRSSCSIPILPAFPSSC